VGYPHLAQRPFASHLKQVKDIWDELVDRFLAIPFVRQQDTLNPVDQVDLLELALKFSKGGILSIIKPLLRWAGKELSSDRLTYYQHALEEAAFTQKTARFIVHGHTHHYELTPLDIYQKDGKPFEQIYFNSGTWRPIYELTKVGDDEEFIGYHEMTYLVFFKGDERSGQAFEAWSGRLGT
jgi:UDP-2,3-diacylglucosamine pyrophosphatase LpxH